MNYTSKPKYHLLNGLRGLAAMLVILYHVGEGFALSPINQVINHGYLAVDFFFVLSGFVIGYSYDTRWQTMTIKEFFLRRLRRLHPLLIIGAVIGAVTFIIQGSVKWDGTHVSLYAVLLALLCNILLIPAIPGSAVEVRGYGEMFPLNGPTWSLFYEYIGNILYAVLLRHLNTRTLFAVVCCMAGCLFAFSVSNGSGSYNMGAGWSLADLNVIGGFLRLTFSYFAGLLLARLPIKEFIPFRPSAFQAFIICGGIMALLLSIPYIGGSEPSWKNGVYDALCIILVFPSIVAFAACSTPPPQSGIKICDLAGDMSYPFYIVHYPFMYLFYYHVWSNNLPFVQAWPCALIVICISLISAFILRNVRI